jgi:hypothetical protein
MISMISRNLYNHYSIQNYLSTIYFHEISWASFNVVSASMAYAKKHPPNPRDFTEAIYGDLTKMKKV